MKLKRLAALIAALLFIALSIAILVTIPVRWEWCGPLPEDTCFK